MFWRNLYFDRTRDLVDIQGCPPWCKIFAPYAMETGQRDRGARFGNECLVTGAFLYEIPCRRALHVSVRGDPRGDSPRMGCTARAPPCPGCLRGDGLSPAPQGVRPIPPGARTYVTRGGGVDGQLWVSATGEHTSSSRRPRAAKCHRGRAAKPFKLTTHTNCGFH